jgi:hypothetical protein
MRRSVSAGSTASASIDDTAWKIRLTPVQRGSPGALQAEGRMLAAGRRAFGPGTMPGRRSIRTNGRPRARCRYRGRVPGNEAAWIWFGRRRRHIDATHIG